MVKILSYCNVMALMKALIEVEEYVQLLIGNLYLFRIKKKRRSKIGSLAPSLRVS